MYSRANFRNPGSYYNIILMTLWTKSIITERLLQRVTEALSSIEGLYPCIGFALQANGLVPDEAGKHCDISQFFIQNGESSSSNKKADTSSSPTITSSSSSSHTPSASPSSSSPSASSNEATTKKGSILEFYSKTQQPPSSSSTSNKRKAGPLDHFCKRRNQDDTKDDNKHWTCDKCSKRIPIDAVDEHTDYHFALDLQLEERASSNNSSSNSHSNVKRSKVEQGQSTKLFFQPR